MYEQARAIRQRLAQDHPTVTAFQSGLANSHNNIGFLLSATGKPSEALAAYEQARAIFDRLARDNPTVTEFQSGLANSHNSIGTLLRATGKPIEAPAAYEQARTIQEQLARDHPESPDYASDLGGKLNNLALLDLNAKRFAEARDTLRSAILWQKKALAAYPKNAQYRQFLANHLTNLIKAARGLGDEGEAAEAQRALDELQASDPKFQALDNRLSAMLQGATPRDNTERLALARRAYDTKHYAGAARLWAEALENDPRLAADRKTQHPYNAACAAALASAGQGRHEPAPNADAKAKLRTRALEWLRNERAAWDRFLAPGPPSVRTTVVQTLQHWKADTDLTSLRDPAALALLPSDEQTAWKALWADVDALLRRARNQPASPPHAPTSELPANPFAPAR
jgi:tetratricopeptide (TPR) repeat protein